MKKFTSVVFALSLLGCHSSSKSGSNSGGNFNADSPQPAANVATDVVWTQIVNASASGSTLTKTGGQGYLDDAGAVTTQKISSGDGWLEVSAADANAYRFVGLAKPHSGTSASGIDFAFRIQAGRADIYEHDQWVADNTVAAGDQLRVAVHGGVVVYSKNGATVYTSKLAPSYPLVGCAALVDAGSAVNGAKIGIGTPAPALAVSGLSAQPGSDGTTATVTWTTSVAADGQVELGTSTSYGTWSVYAGAATTSHSIVVTDLLPATTYHYRVRSEDGSGNHVFSDDAAFTTATVGGVADGGTGTTPTPPPPTAKAHRFCGWLMPTGWVPIDQDPNYADFVAHADQFDAVHPTWYHLSSATTFATNFGEGAAVVFQNTTTGGKRTLLIPTIGVVDNTEAGYARQMLYDDNLRAQHENAIVALVMSKKFDGIDLDYEHLSDSDRDAYSKFAAELAAKLHAQGKTLSHAVGGLTSAKFSSWDYAALSQSSDQLHIMGYDYHFLGSHPGPVAPLGWIQSVVAWAASVNGGATKAKFLLGLPNYGLAGSDSGTTAWFGSAMDSIALTGGTYATTTTHMTSCPFTNGVAMASGRAPNATGTAQGHLYFDDLASMEEKVTAAQALGLGGITYWTIGGEPDRPGNVNFFDMIRSHFPR